MIVRFEVDAFISPVDSSADNIEVRNNLRVPDPPTSSFRPAGTPPAGNKKPPTILRGGTVVPQSSLIEVKSHSVNSATKNKWADIYPQLYLSQISWLYTAIHSDGQFHTLRKTQLGSPVLADVVEKSKARFLRLRLALQIIKDMVIESGVQGRLSFVLENRELRVFGRTSQANFH